MSVSPVADHTHTHTHKKREGVRGEETRDTAGKGGDAYMKEKNQMKEREQKQSMRKRENAKERDV